MALKILLAVLIGLVAASPLHSSPSNCHSTDFTLAMQVDSSFRSLIPIDAGFPNTLNLVAEDLNCCPCQPIPISINGASGNATLDMHVTTKNNNCSALSIGTYGISVADVGERYGTAIPVLATKDYAGSKFFVAGESVQPQMTAGSQLWYGCNRTIKGAEYNVLSWGVYNSNGSSPWGCVVTSVKQVFNIPVSGME